MYMLNRKIVSLLTKISRLHRFDNIYFKEMSRLNYFACTATCHVRLKTEMTLDVPNLFNEAGKKLTRKHIYLVVIRNGKHMN